MQNDQVLRLINNVPINSLVNNGAISPPLNTKNGSSTSINKADDVCPSSNNTKVTDIDASQTFLHLTPLQVVCCLAVSAVVIYGLYYVFIKNPKIVVSEKKNPSEDPHHKDDGGLAYTSEGTNSFNCVLEEPSLFSHIVVSQFKFFFSLLLVFICRRHFFNFFWCNYIFLKNFLLKKLK